MTILDLLQFKSRDDDKDRIIFTLLYNNKKYNLSRNVSKSYVIQFGLYNSWVNIFECKYHNHKKFLEENL